jgi:hypothetical protein
VSLELQYVIPGVESYVAQLHQDLIRASLVPEAVRFEVVTIPDPSPPSPPDLPTDTYEETVFLTMPDGTDEPTVDALVAAFVPRQKYDPTTKLARTARVREIARLKADYDEVLRMGRGLTDFDDAIECLTFLVETLIRRDRAAGLY